MFGMFLPFAHSVMLAEEESDLVDSKAVLVIECQQLAGDIYRLLSEVAPNRLLATAVRHKKVWGLPVFWCKRKSVFRLVSVFDDCHEHPTHWTGQPLYVGPGLTDDTPVIYYGYGVIDHVADFDIAPDYAIVARINERTVDGLTELRNRLTDIKQDMEIEQRYQRDRSTF